MQIPFLCNAAMFGGNFVGFDYYYYVPPNTHAQPSPHAAA
jgi:hypothetical protein